MAYGKARWDKSMSMSMVIEGGQLALLWKTLHASGWTNIVQSSIYRRSTLTSIGLFGAFKSSSNAA
jgi:hypothetical protein